MFREKQYVVGSGETEGVEGLTVVAWIDADNSFRVSVANHDGPTCADPLAYPPGDYEACSLTETLWLFAVRLVPPFDVPGDYPGPAGKELNVSFSSISPTEVGTPCSMGAGAVGATLTLNELSQDAKGVLVAPAIPALASLEFAVPLCP
jgi:hypothetical protein